MSAVVTVTPDEPKIGESITVAATGFGSTDALTLNIMTPDNDGTVTVDDGAAATGGAFTWTDVASFEDAGIAKVTVSDESDNSVTVDVEVFG